MKMAWQGCTGDAAFGGMADPSAFDLLRIITIIPGCNAAVAERSAFRHKISPPGDCDHKKYADLCSPLADLSSIDAPLL
jgi:hypothetical protein